jgi:SAM-dependent methyltransferase
MTFSRTAWTPLLSLQFGLRYLDRQIKTSPRLVGQIADSLVSFPTTSAEIADPTSPPDRQVTESRDLLFNLFEHVFTTPDFNARVRFLIEQFSGKRIIDVGSGTGAYAIAMALRGSQVTCSEINQAKLGYLKWLTSELSLTEVVDFQSSGKYDVALSINVLDHLESPALMVEEISDCLQPGGSLLLYAHFSVDGVHTSHPEVITDTVRALANHFHREPSDNQPGSFLECWKKKTSAREGALELLLPWEGKPVDYSSCRLLVPRIHPDTQVDRLADGRLHLQSARFYHAPIKVRAMAEALLELCTGTRTVEEIVNGSADQAQAFELLLELWTRRFLVMITT